MTILVTGATGRVGRCLIKRLHAAKQPILLATRSGSFDEPHKAVKFDWFDGKTYEAPFDVVSAIDKVFLIQPAVSDPLVYLKPFVELAITKGVKRFVYVSSSALEAGDMVHGKVHEYLARRGVDYYVLRPTTFTENFGVAFRPTINMFDSVFSASGGGKSAFVSVEDVAQAAFTALVAEKSPNLRDPIVVGPQLYSMDEAAEILSNVLGRKITHEDLSPEEYTQRLKNIGMEAKYAEMLAFIQSKYANGSEEAAAKLPGIFVGTHSLVDYFQANKDLWIK
ncbi:hypothetical protein HYPSUDRAFT_69673 [Hypholoma sublateritium FD-334 SS-4]|uniref:NmrA-like domain-containing protein n=1 Tax=Hypholoma sublateritium (strain FD-334 SS-4) TaxID=945553 RepID=A0A0D2KVU0_HYPSF|nr:hypothetical protein HYPSUDRAFT_69673 [Hypholoma sublateritium FD-334 SS-4]